MSYTIKRFCEIIYLATHKKAAFALHQLLIIDNALSNYPLHRAPKYLYTSWDYLVKLVPNWILVLEGLA